VGDGSPQIHSFVNFGKGKLTANIGLVFGFLVPLGDLHWAPGVMYFNAGLDLSSIDGCGRFIPSRTVRLKMIEARN